MSRISTNPALVYSPDALDLKKPRTIEKLDQAKAMEIMKPSSDKEDIKATVEKEKKLVEKEKVEISKEAKELKEKLEKVETEKKEKRLSELSNAEKAHKIHGKKFGDVDKPGIYFVSGFDWFGAGSIKGNYDGIRDMAEAITGANHFGWDEKEEIIEDIMSRRPDEPIVLIGHSFGGDTIVEVANELNTIDHGFRKVALMVTLDSVGMNNDEIPQNVSKNLNYLAQGPYGFLNDGPNIAVNYNKTKIENFLRHELHAELDDSIDIQVRIMDEIDKAVGGKLA